MNVKEFFDTVYIAASMCEFDYCKRHDEFFFSYELHNGIEVTFFLEHVMDFATPFLDELADLIPELHSYSDSITKCGVLFGVNVDLDELYNIVINYCL